MLRYAIIGDWGTGGSLQRSVAKAMNTVAGQMSVAGIISTGDNIYPNGVASAEDPQWKTKFESVYNLPNIATTPWHPVLGNHDHRQSIQAQIDYGKQHPTWRMPARWYSWEESIDAVTKICVVGLDTQPILQSDAVMAEQLAWLDATLAASTARWKIVVGHHPIRSYGHYGDQSFMLTHVKPILDRHRVHVYTCGHDHDVQIIRQPADAFTCIVSGGGGGSRPATKGRYSSYAGTGGGFVILSATPESLDVTVYNALAERLYSGTL